MKYDIRVNRTLRQVIRETEERWVTVEAESEEQAREIIANTDDEGDLWENGTETIAEEGIDGEQITDAEIMEIGQPYDNAEIIPDFTPADLPQEVSFLCS